MPGCVVTGCKTGNYGKIEFQTFPFPKSLKLKEKWLIHVNRDNWKPNQNSRVCGKHFGDEAFCESPVGSQGRKLKKRKLRLYAFPSLHMRPIVVEKNESRSTVNSKELTETNNDDPWLENNNTLNENEVNDQVETAETSFITDPMEWLGINHDHEYINDDVIHEVRNSLLLNV